MPTPPDIDTVLTYLGETDSDDERKATIEAALATEIVAQRKVVRASAFGTDPESPLPPVAYPADLAEAVCRRVARNIALRNVPLAVLQSDAEGGPTATPGKDPEIRRLEGPHRRLPSG